MGAPKFVLKVEPLLTQASPKTNVFSYFDGELHRPEKLSASNLNIPQLTI